jgi:hypothetical protein
MHRSSPGTGPGTGPETAAARPSPEPQRAIAASDPAQAYRNVLQRIAAASRTDLIAEAEQLGLAHQGQSDAQLRRTLASWHQPD